MFAINKVADSKRGSYVELAELLLAGRHDFGVTCSSGSIFLRCLHCGKRSNGWAVHNEQPAALVPGSRAGTAGSDCSSAAWTGCRFSRRHSLHQSAVSA